MATTTLAAVIDVMRTAVVAITPTFNSSVPFKDSSGKHSANVDFRDWCEQNPLASFRWFQIRRVSGITPPFVSNLDLEETEAEVQCTVAYPIDNRYGTDGAKEMDDVIAADSKLIHYEIGTPGYATIETAGDATVITLDRSIEVGTACAFGVVSLRVIWKEAAP